MNIPIPARQVLCELIAKAIAPEAWAEFEQTGGRCTGMAAIAVKESILAAPRVIDALKTAGILKGRIDG